MEELIQRVYGIRVLAHMTHWDNYYGSISLHNVLGDFYSDITEKLDPIVEQYQTVTGSKVGYPQIPKRVGNILDLMTDDVLFIEKNREELSAGTNVIGSLLDNLSSSYVHYKSLLEREGDKLNAGPVE